MLMAGAYFTPSASGIFDPHPTFLINPLHLKKLYFVQFVSFSFFCEQVAKTS